MTQERREKGIVKRFYINQRYQLKYTLMVSVVTTLVTVGFGWLYYINERSKTELLQIKNPELGQLISSTDHYILLYLLLFFVFQFVLFLFFGIYFTHRVAGPVHRLQKYFEEVARTGELKTFDRVRDSDEFQDMFEALTQAIKKLQEKDAQK